MTPKMRALMAGLGAMIAATVAGVAVYVSAPAATTQQADLVDAGLVTDYVPHRLACMVHGPQPDGGNVCKDGGEYCEAQPVVAVSKTLEPDGRRATIWQRAAIPFRDALADSNSNCVDLGPLTWAAVQAEYGGATTADSAGSCACMPLSGAGCTRDDGGAWPTNPDGGLWNNQMPVGSFAGAGCVPISCGSVAGRANIDARCWQ